MILRNQVQAAGSSKPSDRVPRRKRPERGEGLSQEEFYRRCTAAEHEATGRSPDIFNYVEKQAAEERIRKIEHKGPQLGEEPYICAALGLPGDFLKERFQAVTEAVNAAEAHWLGRIRPAMPVREAEATPVRFQRIDMEDLRPAYRAEAFARLDEFCRAAATDAPTLMILEGRTGVGKSYLIAQWVWAEGRHAFAEAVSIDCSNLSLDQVPAQARADFGIDDDVGDPQGSDGSGGRRINAVLVLDGLRVDRDSSRLCVVLPDRRAPMEELVTLINRLWHELGPVAILLGIENNERPVRVSDVGRRLKPEASYLHYRLRRLTDETGADFLLAQRLEKISELDRRELSRRLHGLPIALAAAAEEITSMSKTKLEEYLANLGGPLEQTVANDFHVFFKGWLERHGMAASGQSLAQIDDGRAHPYALLRLLALMQGPISHAELEEILENTKIPRLTERSIDYLARGELPFVMQVDGSYELHIMVRQYLRNELNEYVQLNEFDEFTSLAQLEEIHWQAAHIRRRSLLREELADADTIRIVEAFVHHMTEQIRLIPLDARGRRLTRKVSGYLKSDMSMFEGQPGKVANGKLWWIAFSEAKRFLLDGKASTRVYGQFEAKARILTQLMQVATDEDISLPQEPDLPREVAICWMHAGWLNLALQSLNKREKAVESVERTGNWKTACDSASVEVAIRLRRGDPTINLEKVLAPLLPEATRIALTTYQVQPEGSRMPMRERGALRVLSRAAEVALYSGKPLDALTRFVQAERLQACWPPYIFNGEAARRYAIALVRGRAGNPKAMSKAKTLITKSIELYDHYNIQTGRPGANDIIGFRVLEAGLARVAGEEAAAQMTLLLIEKHEFMQRREATFLAKAEFDLELLRLEVVQFLRRFAGHGTSLSLPDSPERSDLLERARAFSRKMKDADHWVLHLEAEVVVGELLVGRERELQCESLRGLIRRHGYRMRDSDVALLEQGRSPTRILGF